MIKGLHWLSEKLNCRAPYEANGGSAGRVIAPTPIKFTFMALSLAALYGCGSGGSSHPASPGLGEISVAVRFPAISRQTSGGLPLGTNGIKVVVLDPASAALLAPVVVLPRPAAGEVARTTITGIRAGAVLIKGTAYTDSTLDTPLAFAEATAVVSAGQVTQVTVPFLFGSVSTLAGSGSSGESDGVGSIAIFDNPANLAVDRSTGEIFVADFAEDLPNGRIRKVTPDGTVTTLVNQADFQRPFGITVTPGGQLFVETDLDDLGQSGGAIWRVDRASGAASVVVRGIGRPRGLVGLPDGRLVLSDVQHHTLRLLDPSTASLTDLAGSADNPGFANGKGSAAQFNRPYGAALLPDGSVVVADQANNRLRRVALDGTVSTFAGSGVAGSRDGPAALAQFTGPKAVAVDRSGIVYVSDAGNQTIRRVSSDGFVTTIAGNGVAGFRDGPGLTASFYGQEGIALSPDGSILYVADNSAGDPVPFNRIRKITLP